MVLKYKDQEIASLADVQKLTAKDLHIILKSHSELPGGTKAHLVLKVYALLMRRFYHRQGLATKLEAVDKEMRTSNMIRL